MESLRNRAGERLPERESEGASSPLLNKLMEGRKGKKAALAIYCAAKQGLITETDYNSVADRFGDIGSSSSYNRYMGNPPLFTQLEIESTTNLFAKPNEQNDACIKSAMARKGGCEETNVFDKPKAESCLHELC